MIALRNVFGTIRCGVSNADIAYDFALPTGTDSKSPDAVRAAMIRERDLIAARVKTMLLQIDAIESNL